MKTFSDIVETVKKWDDESLEELEAIIKQQLIFKGRKSIKKNFLLAKSEESAKKLVFHKDLQALKRML
jgi:hypothetical protein